VFVVVFVFVGVFVFELVYLLLEFGVEFSLFDESCLVFVVYGVVREKMDGVVSG